ncbi:hypothetical protein CkaCkLH20_09321 [Colletotrichum karsti]|uniref:F-box domain-containing protein n=1 Tax=Colletotrichum karsti TaxID=1095194 RepID=A0A9P6HX87_9PEZI|nr:uncharacterized protein CkaCkLH20_09321 [Colletotrichum karsti]KAF9873158.1 hypothetical protein CkaCkLH20_09321 [Colletotrichum karsti]
MDPTSRFENLPTEVLIHILTHIDDFHCVWNLLISSPASYRIFNHYSKEIFWPAISESTIPSQTQDIIRFIIQLRAGAFQKTNLNDIIRKIKDREGGIVLGKSEELGYDLPTRDSTKVPSLGVLRAVLRTAAQVHCLSRSCIEHYLRQLAAAKEMGRVEWLSREEPMENASWLEEQRVLRALWRVQLVLELRQAARTSDVLCPPEDPECGASLDLESFYDSRTSNLKAAYHEVMTVLDYLQTLEDGKSGAGLSRRDSLPLPPVSSLKDLRPATMRTPDTAMMRRSHLVMPTDSLWIVDSMGRGAHSPIKYAGFEPYRSLGFAVWDRHRLAHLGLASPPGHGRVTGLGSYFSCWLRLLSAEDLARAEERMREAESQGGRLEPLQPMIQDNAS